MSSHKHSAKLMSSCCSSCDHVFSLHTLWTGYHAEFEFDGRLPPPNHCMLSRAHNLLNSEPSDVLDKNNLALIKCWDLG